MTKYLTFSDKDQTHQMELIEDEAGGQWIKGTELCQALGYKNPGQSAAGIYKHKKIEFPETMMRKMTVPTKSGKQEAIVFSVSGAYMLTFYSHTETAKAFRKWMMELIDKNGLNYLKHMMSPTASEQHDVIIDYTPIHSVLCGIDSISSKLGQIKAINLPKSAGTTLLSTQLSLIDQEVDIIWQGLQDYLLTDAQTSDHPQVIENIRMFKSRTDLKISREQPLKIALKI